MSKHPTDLLAYLRQSKSDSRPSPRLWVAGMLHRMGDGLNRLAIRIAPEMIRLEM